MHMTTLVYLEFVCLGRVLCDVTAGSAYLWEDRTSHDPRGPGSCFGFVK